MGIANIMLANNICDMEDDLENRRYTLPIYIGREMALVLFKALYFIAGLSVILGLVLKTIPITGILFFITLIPVYKNIKAFEQKQSKAETFGLAVKNFTIMNTVLIFSFLLSVGIRLFF
jgi:1,4-dihydroxy-2-naphthoate octaprenyltransferase